jgi:ABC-type Na+ efflux pump permease subunit
MVLLIANIVTLLLMPLIMFLAGLYLYKTGTGFNSFMAWRSVETQTFSSRMCGRLIIRVTPIILLFGVIGSVLSAIFRANETAMGIIISVGLSLQTIIIFIPVILTLRALKRTFDSKGNRR